MSIAWRRSGCGSASPQRSRRCARCPSWRFEARRLQPVSVNRSALVGLEGAWYSVPERWAGLSVIAAVGVEEVTLSLGTERVSHRRQRFGGRRVSYRHYLGELSRKPQAVRQVAIRAPVDAAPPHLTRHSPVVGSAARREGTGTHESRPASTAGRADRHRHRLRRRGGRRCDRAAPGGDRQHRPGHLLNSRASANLLRYLHPTAGASIDHGCHRHRRRDTSSPDGAHAGAFRRGDGGTTVRPAGRGGALPGGLVLVAEQSGLILLLDATTGEGGTFLDLRSQVSRDANEEGLLSLELDPEFASNGRLYAYYSVEEGERRTRLSRFTAHGAAADPGSELAILEVAQPFRNHNGGAVRFGPDGMLYLGLGDGGSAGDPQANGQDPGTLLGTILRIDVRRASESETYRIPPDNPLVDASGARPEVWAYGLRNPWRMTFDPQSGELWAGDVGQQRIEEVDRIVRGGNYGWNRLEGDDCYRPRSDCDPGGTVLPATSYNHDQGCSITGGVVYRGAQVPELNGRYVYGDFCSGRVWALDVASGGDGIRVADTGAAISSFAQIGEELWLLRFGGAVLRATSP